MALSITFRNPFKVNWTYERLKDGTNWYQMIGDQSNWELGDKLKCALETPPLFRAIDIIADKVSQVEFLVDGEPNDSHPLIQLLNNPNPFQSKQDFLKEFIFFKYPYGWVYQYPVTSTGFKDPKYIFNLNPSKVKYDERFATRAIFGSDADLLKETMFTYEEDNQEKKFGVKDVIMFFDIANGLSENFLLKAPSRLDSIQKQIKNIGIAGEAKQRAIRKAGRFLLTGENQGNLVKKGLGTDEKEQIETKLNQYGLANNKNDIIATTAKDLKTHGLHISGLIKETDEGVKDDAQIIMNAFGVSRELYPLDKSGSTYENQKEAYINLIQSVVQTDVNDLINTYKSYFGYTENITASLAHLPEMQHIENLKADKMLKVSAAIRNIQGTGITEEQLFAMADMNIEGNE